MFGSFYLTATLSNDMRHPWKHIVRWGSNHGLWVARVTITMDVIVNLALKLTLPLKGVTAAMNNKDFMSACRPSACIHLLMVQREDETFDRNVYVDLQMELSGFFTSVHRFHEEGFPHL